MKRPVVTGPKTQSVEISTAHATLNGDLVVPRQARMLIVFAHGSGSSRLSPRNRAVAGALNAAGFATLLFDLLTREEEVYDEAMGGVLRFDIPLLAGRLVEATDWAGSAPPTAGLPVGYFGASTGAAAALMAATRRPAAVAAVVSRGGRPDLTGSRLGHVAAPTLLIVGGADEQVLALNQQVLSEMRCEARLAVVPGATHRFEEPGALARVAELAAGWFGSHIPAAGEPDPPAARALEGFEDRAQAGDELAAALAEYAGRHEVVVLGIARGGVAVAASVARGLAAKLDVVVVRKLGLPGQEELAMGAIGPGGIRVMNPDLLRQLPVPATVVDVVARREQAELERREQLYRSGRPALALAGKTVLVVDDGLATGSTMRAAIAAVRAQRPAEVVVAVPVAAESSLPEIEHEADRVVCLIHSDYFFSVGQWYRDFSQTSDEQVRQLLAAAGAVAPKAGGC